MHKSNCLIEAVKAKIRHPFSVHIHFMPPSLNDNKIHFFWTKNNFVYHCIHQEKNVGFLFEGKIKKYHLDSFVARLMPKFHDANWPAKKVVRMLKHLGVKDVKEDDIEFELSLL